MLRDTEIYYLGRDDVLEWRLHGEAGPFPESFYQGITRCVLHIGDAATLDSRDNPLAITWGTGNSLQLRLKHAKNLTPGRHQARLIVYTWAEPDGLEDWRQLPWIVVRESGE